MSIAVSLLEPQALLVVFLYQKNKREKILSFIYSNDLILYLD